MTALEEAVKTLKCRRIMSVGWIIQGLPQSTKSMISFTQKNIFFYSLGILGHRAFLLSSITSVELYNIMWMEGTSAARSVCISVFLVCTKCITFWSAKKLPAFTFWDGGPPPKLSYSGTPKMRSEYLEVEKNLVWNVLENSNAVHKSSGMQWWQAHK